MSAVFHHWPLRKRARRACSNCWVRKVRCDAEEYGLPCKHCRSDGTVCRLRDSRAGRWASQAPAFQRRHKALRPRPKEDEIQVEDVDISSRQLRPVHTQDWLHSHASKPEDSLYSEEFAATKDVLVERNASKADEILSDQQERDPINSLVSLFEGPGAELKSLTMDMSTNPSSVFSTGSTQTDPNELPKFIKPLSPLLAPEDIQYLWTKGALQLPPASLRRTIVAAYVQSIHPFFPLLQLSAFLGAAFDDEQDRDQQTSILLFQAVMFVAVAFVGHEDIQEAGFASQRVARQVFYDRVRLLYEFGVETDCLTNIQALILMSQYTETPGDSKGSWHWIGIAHSLALNLGIHRARDFEALTPAEISLRRRVWWSCYTRDRLIALSLHRPTRIRDDEFDTSMLTAKDFEFDILEPEFKAWVSNTLGVELIDPQSQAERSANLAQLCRILGEILSLHFFLLPEANCIQVYSDHTGKTSPLVFLRSDPARIASFTPFDDRLQSWQAQLPSSCIYRPPEFPSSSDRSKASILHTASLSMIFSAAVLTLHRPILHQRGLENSGMQKSLARRRVCEAASRISSINRDLHALHLHGYLPTTMVSVQLQAIGTFLTRLNSANDRETGDLLDHAITCLQTIEALQIYHGSDFAIVLLQDVMKRAKATIHFGSSSVILGLTYNGQSRWLDSTPPQVREAALRRLAIDGALTPESLMACPHKIANDRPATQQGDASHSAQTQSSDVSKGDSTPLTRDDATAESGDITSFDGTAFDEQSFTDSAMDFDIFDFFDFDWPTDADDLVMVHSDSLATPLEE